MAEPADESCVTVTDIGLKYADLWQQLDDCIARELVDNWHA
jgi:hypothetical protein